MNGVQSTRPTHRAVRIPVSPNVTLDGDLSVPAGAEAIVIFAHGAGSNRLSPRNRMVADSLQAIGQATLLIDLLTKDEQVIDEHTQQLRFDISLLAERLVKATDWVTQNPETSKLHVGYFGASTGAAAALAASVQRPDVVKAIVSRGGRPDLAKAVLEQVKAPTLLIVGGNDYAVIGLNENAKRHLRSCEVHLTIVPGASHLFEEPGAMEEVSTLAVEWFTRYLL
jgi:dienelactone hydrolase